MLVRECSVRIVPMLIDIENIFEADLADFLIILSITFAIHNTMYICFLYIRIQILDCNRYCTVSTLQQFSDLKNEKHEKQANTQNDMPIVENATDAEAYW